MFSIMVSGLDFHSCMLYCYSCQKQALGQAFINDKLRYFSFMWRRPYADDSLHVSHCIHNSALENRFESLTAWKHFSFTMERRCLEAGPLAFLWIRLENEKLHVLPSSIFYLSLFCSLSLSLSQDKDVWCVLFSVCRCWDIAIFITATRAVSKSVLELWISVKV